MLAILDDKLLFIHGHSVKGIERVVRMRTRRQGYLDDEDLVFTRVWRHKFQTTSFETK